MRAWCHRPLPLRRQTDETHQSASFSKRPLPGFVTQHFYYAVGSLLVELELSSTWDSQFCFLTPLGSHQATTQHTAFSSLDKHPHGFPLVSFAVVFVVSILYCHNRKNHHGDDNNNNRNCNSAALFLHSTFCHLSSFAARMVYWIGARRRGGHCRTCRIHLVLLLLL